jgi:LytR cell envelope-related transcriptional attenuator
VTTPAPGGGPSPLRLGGLALIGAAVVAAIIGLASMATPGDPVPTAAPSPSAPSSEPPPAAVPPPALPPAEPLPTSDGTVPVPSFGAPAPGETPPGPVPPAEPAPAPGAPAPQPPPGAPAPEPSGGDGNGARSGDARGASGGTSAVRAPLRIYNNSTITGLANRAADDFRRAGWPIDEVGNYPHGIIPTTTVYYRPGTDEEAPARALGERFGMRVNPRFEGLQNATPGIIVIVTNDYGR